MLVDWDLVTKTLEHIRNLTSDTEMLKDKYQLVLVDKPPGYDESQANEDGEREQASVKRFKRLFGSSDRYNSTAAAKVIQAKTSHAKKLRWAAVDKKNMQSLTDDISHFVGKLNSTLDSTIQNQMSQNLELLLQEATNRYSNVPDLEYLKEIVTEMKETRSQNATQVDADKLDEEIEKKFAYALHNAIGHDNVTDVLELLDKGIGADVEDQVGWSPLINAAQRGHIPMVKLLLERGADPLKGTIGQRLPLHFAAENGHTDTVRLLLEQPNVDPNAPDHDGRTAIFNAADKGHEAVVRLLLEQPRIVPSPMTNSGFSPLIQTIFGSHTDIIRLFLARPDVNPNEADKTYNQTPLWMAATCNDGEYVRIFLSRKEKDLDLDAPSRFGETALGRCARQGYLAAGKLLIEAGANINKPNEDGQTPLSAAAATGQELMVETLLACPGISVDVADTIKGHTPLHRACDANQTKCVKLLLAHTDPPANIDAVDKDGNTALHLAAAKGHKIAAKLLLRSKSAIGGGDGKEGKVRGDVINRQNNKGNTPLALAAATDSNTNEAVTRLLLESGADPGVEDEDMETAFEKARDRHLNGIVGVFREVLKM